MNLSQPAISMAVKRDEGILKVFGMGADDFLPLLIY